MSKFVLASGSKIRLKLLEKINFKPDIICPADIDETPFKKEKPIDYVKRMAETKAEFVNQKYFGNVILSADTIVNYQARIIQKAKTDDEIRELLKFYSNKNIKLITSIYMINSNNIRTKKTVETTIKFKNISKRDIDEYVLTKQGIGNSGGVSIEGFMDSFAIKIIGNYSNILGLPLYQVRNMLISAGVKTTTNF